MIETFVDAVARHARERPAATALVDARERLTWRQTITWVEAAGGWLADQRLQRGAAVIGWLPNAAEWYLLRLACEHAGLLWVPVAASQGARELGSIARRVRPAVIATSTCFRGREYLAEAATVCREAGIDAIGLAVPETTLLRLDGRRVAPSGATRPEEPAHVLATTGSEGTPKLSVYTLAAAVERGRAQAALLRMTPEDVVVALSTGTGPGKTPWLAAPLAGACVVTLPVFRPLAALELAARERATMIAGTPAQLTMMLPELGRFDLSSVRVWYTAGSVLPSALAEELESRTRGVVVSVYGATDFGGWAAPELDDPPDVRYRTVGRPRGGTEFRIVGADGRDEPPGGIGEVLGRGPCCVSGYVGDAELTQERWRDGWFRTEDVGRLDAAGNLVIVGRARDLIIRGGENIAPEEIETLLRGHPAVRDVAVVGVPDGVLDERVCACVVAVPGTRPTLATLREHLRAQRIAHYKLPERLVVVPSLPTIGDKVDRAALVARATRATDGESAPS